MQIEELPFLDYEDPAFLAEPFVWLSQSAANWKIARSERGVEVLDYDLARNMLMDKSLGTDHANLVERMGLPDSRALTFKRNMLLTHNRGATRKRLRRILSELVGPAQAEGMREEVSRVVSRLLDTLPDTSFDLKHDFTDLVPASVYCSWVNAPPSDARFVADMSEAVLAIFQRNPELTPTIVNAYDELFAYARQRLDERESARGDDFLSKLLACRDRGDLSETELEDYAVMLIEASTDNTSHQLAITVDRLLNIPGLWPTLANDRHQVSDIIQEVMRLWPRSISTSRTALEDTELGGVSLPKGTSIFASFGACHRQADKFGQPHEFKPGRAKTPSHLNFGGGAFSCLGQFIANIEMEEAVAQLASRYPNLTIIDVERHFTPMFQTVPRLVVVTGKSTV